MSLRVVTHSSKAWLYPLVPPQTAVCQRCKRPSVSPFQPSLWNVLRCWQTSTQQRTPALDHL
jgi:hypothetical protein